MKNPVLFGNNPLSERTTYSIAPSEYYVSLHELRLQSSPRHRPGGDYDVTALVAAMPAPWNKPGAIVCSWDSDGRCNPVNLAPLDCPKILIVGDTHHGLSPLSRAIALARQEPWDLIVLAYNKHHVSWFEEAGIGSGRAVFLPCFGLRPLRKEMPSQRTRGVVMCGRLSNVHVYRRCFLGSLLERGIPFDVMEGTSEECARAYNEAVVSLNISLNGDFNNRNIEIAAAGGFCLGDRTAVDESERPGAVFQSVDDAVRIIHHFLAHPEESLAKGRQDQATFSQNYVPEKQTEQLMAALATPKGPRFTPSVLFYDRLTMYEELQDFTRRGRIHWEDFQDLRRWEKETYPGPFA